MSDEAERLLHVLRTYRYSGMQRHYLTVPPTVDRRQPLQAAVLDAALEELREAGYRIIERRRRRGGMRVYWLSGEPPSPPRLFDIGRTRDAT